MSAVQQAVFQHVVDTRKNVQHVKMVNVVIYLLELKGKRCLMVDSISLEILM